MVHCVSTACVRPDYTAVPTRRSSDLVHPVRIGLSLLACLLCLPAVAAERDWRLDRPHPVVDPAYGQILYDYYQGQQFAALSHIRSEEHTSELQSRESVVCRLLLEKKH